MIMAEESEKEAPAIKALGSLFKLTQVYLWDDAVAELLESSTSFSAYQNGHHNATSTNAKFDSVVQDFTPALEDMELTQQMNALGLPVSFTTNKRGTAMKKARRIGAKGNPTSGLNVNKDAGLDVSEVKDGEVVSPVNLHDNTQVSLCCISTLATSETSYSEIAEVAKSNCFSNGRSVSMEEACVEITGALESWADGQDAIPCETMTSSTVEMSVSPIHEEDESFQENFMDAHFSSETEKFPLDTTTEEPYIPDSVSSQSSVMADRMLSECDNHRQCLDPENWMVCWDSFYMRNFYYNSTTQESTWHPPPGVEYIELAEGQTKTIDTVVENDMVSNNSSAEVLDPSALQCKTEVIASSSNSSVHSFHETPSEIEPAGSNAISGLDSTTVDYNFQHLDDFDFSEIKKISDEETSLHSTITKVSSEEWNIGSSKKKKKVRRTRTQRRYSEGMPLEFPDDMIKYWCQRYSLFSRYDEGIKMDEEGWFSVTPESIAIHQAERCGGGGTIIDSFTGAGGNAIQLAKRGNHVIAVDIDSKKIEYAQHNASIYGVATNIDFVEGDFFQLALAMKIKVDVVFLSPPWGGPDYLKVERYDMKTMLKPHDGWYLFHTSRRIASRIVMFLPRNVDLNQLAEIAMSVEPPWALEVERNYLNRKLKAITAYFTDTASML